MNAWVQSIALVVFAIIWLMLKSGLEGIKQMKHWLKDELDIQVTWLELLKTSAFFLSCLTITGLVLAVLQN